MQRNKTQRRRGPSTPATEYQGNFGGDTVVKATEDSLDALFAAEAATNFQQPWQKLDRGSRLDRLRKFVQNYPDLSPAERASLLTAILQSFELRQLNTKLAVDYDPATATVTAVRGLRERVTPVGFRTFRIDAQPAVRATQKQPRAPKVPANLNPPPADSLKDNQ
jgi:hypothetical protein